VVLKEIKYLIRRGLDGRLIIDIVGKKDSIIKLCRAGKLKRRKCRKYPLGGYHEG